MDENKHFLPERLASLEVKFEFLRDILKEVKDGIKDNDQKEELSKLVERISKLEEKQNKLTGKVAVIVGITTILLQASLQFIIKLINL